MKQTVEKRKPSGMLDYTALALTTWGVGYIPGAPGTYGSIVAVAIYLGFCSLYSLLGDVMLGRGFEPEQLTAFMWAVNSILITALVLAGIRAATRSIPLLGGTDPHEAVIDEVQGQLVTFLFIPFGLGWPFILAGFLLFRLFDIWKPYPIDDLQVLPGGLGICADDLLAGVYAGICLAIGYAVYLAI